MTSTLSGRMSVTTVSVHSLAFNAVTSKFCSSWPLFSPFINLLFSVIIQSLYMALCVCVGSQQQ